MAKAFGLEKGNIAVMIHTGSRGCGHQICSDYLRAMDKAYRNYKINIPDRQLACAPLDSKEAIGYLKSMAAGANYAWANRQMITHWVRQSFEEIFNRSSDDMGMSIVYDVAHNIAKQETHKVNNKKMDVLVHRKGATRAFGPGRKEIPKAYRSVGMYCMEQRLPWRNPLVPLHMEQAEYCQELLLRSNLLQMKSQGT